LNLFLALFTHYLRFSRFLLYFGYFWCIFLLNKASFLSERGLAPSLILTRFELSDGYGWVWDN
jgi:hypothetical protein